MIMKEYFTFPKGPGREPHHQIQLSFIPKTLAGRRGIFTSLERFSRHVLVDTAEFYLNIRIHTHTHIHTRTHTHTHTHTHILTHIRRHKDAHTHTHTHTLIYIYIYIYIFQSPSDIHFRTNTLGKSMFTLITPDMG